MGGVGIIWFRHGLRIHDNPALMHLLDTVDVLYPIFIFDGEVAGTKLCGYNRWRFLYESLQDLGRQFVQQGGFFYVFKGKPTDIFTKIIKEWGVTHVAFEQDPEPVWQDRDTSVKQLCDKLNIDCQEFVSHTLWNPYEVIEENGGKPPITFATFNEVVHSMGLPEYPTSTPDFRKVKLNVLSNSQELYALPPYEEIGVPIETELQKKNIWKGGELTGLELLKGRIEHEIKAFKEGICLPNQYTPNLVDAPMSLSPYLRFGCVSVRLFYWRIREAFNKVKDEKLVDKGITEASVNVQLIWREFFYTMSVNNINYSQMKDNPICLQINWKNDPDMLERWKLGQTGYPWIDACMRQLHHEGWMHQVGRHAVACFLTRGDLWISWEDGLKVFYQWLLDADWSICAGNWMWISSSAFEKFLSCPNCFCPVKYGQRMDPSGKFVRRWVPELAKYPDRFLFEPWRAPRAVQERAKCIVGKDYPEVITDHKQAASLNSDKMKSIVVFLQEQNIGGGSPPDEPPALAKAIEEVIGANSPVFGGFEGGIDSCASPTAETTQATSLLDAIMGELSYQSQEPLATSATVNFAAPSTYMTASTSRPISSPMQPFIPEVEPAPSPLGSSENTSYSSMSSSSLHRQLLLMDIERVKEEREKIKLEKEVLVLNKLVLEKKLASFSSEF